MSGSLKKEGTPAEVSLSGGPETDRITSSQSLEASTAPAPTSRSVRKYYLMPHFRRASGNAYPALAIDHQSASYSGSEREHDHATRAHSRAKCVLTKCSHICVIAHDDRQTGGHSQWFADLHAVPPSEVGRPSYNTFVGKYGSWHSHANTQNPRSINTRSGYGVSNRRGYLRDRSVYTVHGPGVGTPFSIEVTTDVCNGRSNVRPPQIYPNNVRNALIRLHPDTSVRYLLPQPALFSGPAISPSLTSERRSPT